MDRGGLNRSRRIKDPNCKHNFSTMFGRVIQSCTAQGSGSCTEDSWLVNPMIRHRPTSTSALKQSKMQNRSSARRCLHHAPRSEIAKTGAERHIGNLRGDFQHNYLYHHCTAIYRHYWLAQECNWHDHPPSVSLMALRFELRSSVS